MLRNEGSCVSLPPTVFLTWRLNVWTGSCSKMMVHEGLTTPDQSQDDGTGRSYHSRALPQATYLGVRLTSLVNIVVPVPI